MKYIASWSGGKDSTAKIGVSHGSLYLSHTDRKGAKIEKRRFP